MYILFSYLTLISHRKNVISWVKKEEHIEFVKQDFSSTLLCLIARGRIKSTGEKVIKIS